MAAVDEMQLRLHLPTSEINLAGALANRFLQLLLLDEAVVVRLKHPGINEKCEVVLIGWGKLGVVSEDIWTL